MVLQLHLVSSWSSTVNGQELETLCKSPQALAKTSSLGPLAGSAMGASGVCGGPRNGHGSMVGLGQCPLVVLVVLPLLGVPLGHHGSHCR